MPTVEQSLEQEKSRRYTELLPQIGALLEDEVDLIANLANLVAALKEANQLASWVGIYVLKANELVLGPFQGKTACTRIALGRGVCGRAALWRSTVVVPDVTTFEDHIACDADSRSEIVVPIVRGQQLLGVLDLDSGRTGAFDEIDAQCLERIANLAASLNWPGAAAET